MKTLWVSVGEVSGDMHASHVIRELLIKDPTLQIRGIGGTYLQNAGMECIFSISLLSTMGIWDVIKKSFTIWKLVRKIKQDFLRSQPDALLVVDAPSFNFLLIKIAKKMGIPVYYYILPKVWASRPRRAYFLQQYCTALFSIFPFEVTWLQQYNINAQYVGNPLIESITPLRTTLPTHKEANIILMPGSRKSEIDSLFPLFIKVVQRLQQYNPHLRFSYILAPSLQQDYLEQYIPSGVQLQCIQPEERYKAIAQSSLCIVASGTATLETALLMTPTIATYRLGKLSAWIMKQFITIPYVSLPNIIMNRHIIPELLQEDANVENLYRTAISLLQDTKAYEEMRCNFEALYQELASPYTTSTVVAQHILEQLTKSSQ